ncbi:hypothetical protein B0H19DRAFT_1237479 [Mycena capillaripes]|nr:hypothetical protein B0H19DRAFT_1237479 [Mycena capillaripes]
MPTMAPVQSLYEEEVEGGGRVFASGVGEMRGKKGKGKGRSRILRCLLRALAPAGGTPRACPVDLETVPVLIQSSTSAPPLRYANACDAGSEWEAEVSSGGTIECAETRWGSNYHPRVLPAHRWWGFPTLPIPATPTLSTTRTAVHTEISRRDKSVPVPRSPSYTLDEGGAVWLDHRVEHALSMSCRPRRTRIRDGRREGLMRARRRKGYADVQGARLSVHSRPKHEQEKEHAGST